MRISHLISASAAAILLVGAGTAASAGTIYSNEFDGSNGDCSFNTACAAGASRGDDFAAQLFTLSSAATVLSGSFVTLDGGVGGPTVNWAFYGVNGDTSLPGLLLASGSSSDVHSGDLGGGCCGLAAIRTSFNISSVSLAASSYYFAVQYVTPTFQNYLSQGVANSGAAETHDGGSNWSANYQGLGGDAVALYDTALPGGVPEPATWGLMLVGFGGLGAVLRRRRSQVALTA
jgi:hypothetical protein